MVILFRKVMNSNRIFISKRIAEVLVQGIRPRCDVIMTCRIPWFVTGSLAGPVLNEIVSTSINRMSFESEGIYSFLTENVSECNKLANFAIESVVPAVFELMRIHWQEIV